jgi:hypothetical protein
MAEESDVASEKDILDKADALLRRHAPPSAAIGSDTGGVPVLTDIIGGPDDDPHGELAAEVFRRVMTQVERRLAVDLEQRLVQQLTPQVHAAVASALGDLRQELANAIGDAVAEAFASRKVK